MAQRRNRRFAYGGAIAVALLSARLRNPALLWLAFGAVVAALVFALVLPHLTIDNYSFLWSRDIEKTGTTRMALMPSVWTAMRSSLLFAASQTLIVALVATPAAYALSRFTFAGRENVLRGLCCCMPFRRSRSPSRSSCNCITWACSTISSASCWS